jgi:alpha-glucosidase
VQAGILMPRFSIHSWNSDGTVNEPWMHPAATTTIVDLLALRQAWTPLLYDLLWRHHADYEPVTRPLWLEFPDDPRAWQDGDEYLLGPNLLVAPALDPGVDSVAAYLPSGADWNDIRDDRAFAGGATVDLPAPLRGPPPMLARTGSAVFIDLAPGGHAHRQMQPAVLLYAPLDDGRMVWTGFDDDGVSWPDDQRPPLWRLDIRTDIHCIDITASWQGTGRPPASCLQIALPAAELRGVRVNGQTVEPRLQLVHAVCRRVVEWRHGIA